MRETDDPPDHAGEAATPELLRRCGLGDDTALRTMLERYLPGLRAYVRLHAGPLLRSKESCSDLVQSACREVLEHAGDFRFGGEPGFRRWLYRTALRKVEHRRAFWRAHKRDAGREVALPATAVQGDSALLACYRAFYTPSQQAAAREELARVEAAFDRLPPDYREVIVLAKLVGLSRAEIAHEFGRTEVAVRSMLSRALAQLASELVAGTEPA